MTAKAVVPSKVRSIRADEDAWEVLDWWVSTLETPVELGSLIRAAMEDARDAVLAYAGPNIDAEAPDSIMLKRIIARRLLIPKPPVDR